MTTKSDPTTTPRKSPDERRHSQRFKAPEKTLAITQDFIGQIVDISASGCKFRYIDNSGTLSQQKAMDIMMSDSDFYLEHIPIAMAWQERPESAALSTITIREVGVYFSPLLPAQQDRIDHFIKKYAIGLV